MIYIISKPSHSDVMTARWEPRGGSHTTSWYVMPRRPRTLDVGRPRARLVATKKALNQTARCSELSWRAPTWAARRSEARLRSPRRAKFSKNLENLARRGVLAWRAPTSGARWDERCSDALRRGPRGVKTWRRTTSQPQKSLMST